MEAYRLKFKSALHVDSRGSGEPESVDTFIRSDTLSAALCLAWNTLYPDHRDELFLNPPFRVSSAFPYIHGLHFFPAPLWPFWKDADPAVRKRRKSVKWLSASLTREILSGTMLDWDEVGTFAGDSVAVSLNQEAKASGWAGGAPWVVSERQRVSVDRLGGGQEGLLFFFGLQYFASECGLYFMVDCDPGHRDRFEATLAFLGDTGIGADRNNGLGHFVPSRVEQFSLSSTKKDVNHEEVGWYTLSLFNPGAVDDLAVLTRHTAYGLTMRSGWITGSTMGRPPVRVFTEGSYFSGRPAGRIVELFVGQKESATRAKVGHPVTRDFRAMALPCAAPSSLQGGRP